ncbi:MAG: tetratricopeptide repeat protein [Planctomycetota bacterium]|jgi:tetratricopeptide (TPR) repeat protein
MKSRNFVLAFAFLLCAAGVGTGQEGADEEELARAYLERGMLDLADDAFRKMVREGKSEGVRHKGELGLIDVLKRKAEIEPDPERAKALIGEAVERYRAFLKKGHGDPWAYTKLGGILKEKGLSLSRRARALEGEAKAAMYAAAAGAFEEAIGGFTEALKWVERTHGPGVPEEAPVRVQELRRDALFERADLHLYLARAWSEDPEKARETRHKAYGLLEEVVWDYEEFGIGYLATNRMGTCARELGDFGKAVDHFQTVLDIPSDETGKQALKEVRDRLRLMAYHGASQALVEAGEFHGAVELVERMEREYPASHGDGSPDPYSARGAILEKAKALKGLQRLEDAVKEVVRVIEGDLGSRRGALDLLDLWGVARMKGMGVEIKLLQAEGQVRSGKLSGAIATYGKAIEAIRSDEELKRFGPRAWKELGQVYWERSLHYEAGMAFQKGEEVAHRFIGGKRRNSSPERSWLSLWDSGAENAFMAYRSFQRSKKTLDSEDAGKKIDGLIRALRSILTTRYPESAYSENLHYFAGKDYQKEGRYDDALDAYREVKSDSKYFPAARLGMGEARIKLFEAHKREKAGGGAALDEKGKEHLRAAQDALENVTHQGSEGTASSPQLRARARYYLGRVHVELGEWGKVLEVLEAFEDRVEERPDLVQLSADFRLRAFIELGKPREAEDMIRVMEDAMESLAKRKDASPARRTLLAGYQRLGSLYHRMAQREANRDPEAASEYRSRSGDYLWKWVDGRWLSRANRVIPKKDLPSVKTVGGRLYLSSRFERATACYERVLASFDGTSGSEDIAGVQRALAECYFAQAQWEKALPLYVTLYRGKGKRSLLERISEANYELGSIAKERGDLVAAHTKFDEALEGFAELVIPRKPHKKSWWVWQYAVWRILFFKGKNKIVVNQIQGVMEQYEEMGGPEMKAKILKLQDMAKEVGGRRMRAEKGTKKKGR